MPKLPHFKTDAEVAEFWDTHDSTDYFDELEEVNIRYEVVHRDEALILQLFGEDLAAKIARVAARKGMNEPALLRMWVQARLVQEGELESYDPNTMLSVPYEPGNTIAPDAVEVAEQRVAPSSAA